ncbi:hypothetical protein AAFF_G00183210 [Aldrovandia affinis]|uniref:Uncharacterized protein n=1 Tax=Aldrovandia affinis TaxID=143900 RepID=A0AAD7W667_9TELE|nr:hypothetical protein AAFF_G00183210 [Aldrovandia affinis]
MQTVGLIHTLEQCLNRMQTVGLIHTLEQCLNRMSGSESQGYVGPVTLWTLLPEVDTFWQPRVTAARRGLCIPAAPACDVRSFMSRSRRSRVPPGHVTRDPRLVTLIIHPPRGETRAKGRGQTAEETHAAAHSALFNPERPRPSLCPCPLRALQFSPGLKNLSQSC